MNAEDAYERICGFSPYSEQKKIFDYVRGWDLSHANPLFVRLPCGYGKTESIIAPFLTQAVENEWRLAPRLVYLLPTRALCNQMRERVQGYAARAGRIVVGIEHGVSSLDPLFFSDICFTTFDQFLYGYARSKPQIGRHLDVPAGSFANSVIVFDEAHLYSPYTHALMKALLEVFCHSKVPTVVMTATMPESLQSDFFDGLHAHSVEYGGGPLVDRKISWRTTNWRLLDNDKPSNELVNTLSKGKSKKILIVVNRVDIAQKLAKGLVSFEPFLIHSRFSTIDRKARESDAISLLGKGDARKAGVVISTQVCEVGLDISCDLLITECASADALVQRIGRVMRWGGTGKVMIAYPEKSVPYVDKKLGGRGDFVKVTWDYLDKNPDLDFTSWADSCDFCNIMPYRVDYVEARNALGQLFEATLYADTLPYNLSARDELYCTIFVTKAESDTEVPYCEVRSASMNVPYYWFKRFWGPTEDEEGRRGRKGLRIAPYDPRKQKLGEFTVTSSPQPFRIYGIQEENGIYEPDIGFRPKVVVEDEESCLIC